MGRGPPLTQFDDANLAVRSKCVRALRFLGCHGVQERGVGWATPGFFNVRLNCVCWPNMVTIIYTALSLQRLILVILVFSRWEGAFAELVSGGGGSSGLWDQMGGVEITADCELQPLPAA